jgi:hypothetical protein
VWQYIGESLEAVAHKHGQGRSATAEELLTQRLVDDLLARPGDRPYYFHKEYVEDSICGHRPRGDVAVLTRDNARLVVGGILYAGRTRFLLIETKRLPTPGTGREREYLTGDLGGVERFKLGRHGVGLRAVGIIGYVQRHGFEHWRCTINGWVDELVAGSAPGSFWGEDDKLLLESASTRLAWLRSHCLRVTDNQRLTIRHLWVLLGLGDVAKPTPAPSASTATKSPT